MDWLLFIFKRENHHYLVSGESETNGKVVVLILLKKNIPYYQY